MADGVLASSLANGKLFLVRKLCHKAGGMCSHPFWHGSSKYGILPWQTIYVRHTSKGVQNTEKLVEDLQKGLRSKVFSIRILGSIVFLSAVSYRRIVS
jgi:hypothetical protein